MVSNISSEELEARLHHKDIVRTVALGCLGIGCVKRVSWTRASTWKRRDLRLTEIRYMVEEGGQTIAVGLRQQGKLTCGEGARERKIIRADI